MSLLQIFVGVLRVYLETCIVKKPITLSLTSQPKHIYAVGTQKSRLNEMVPLSTQNTCKKIITISHAKKVVIFQHFSF